MGELANDVGWRIGNGSTVSLWYDRWLGGESLADLVDGNVHDRDRHLRVNHVWDARRGWQLNFLYTRLTEEVVDRMLQWPMPANDHGGDSLTFLRSPNGVLTCKSAYQALTKSGGGDFEDGWGAWSWIWGTKCQAKLKHFMWLWNHGRLVTNMYLCFLGLREDPICSLCGECAEGIDHTLRSCAVAKTIWEAVVAPTQWIDFFSMEDAIWLKRNMVGRGFRNMLVPEAPWSMVFLCTAWNIWKWRNQVVYGQQQLNDHGVVRNIVRMVVEHVEGFGKFRQEERRDKEVVSRWMKPDVSWVKLNCDASLFASTGSVAAGGLARDAEGRWIFRFAQRLRGISINVAELLAVREGLHLVWERRFEKIMVETDSEVVFQLLEAANTREHTLHYILEDCRAYKRLPWDMVFKHTRRGGNSCADFLAKAGHEVVGLKVWNEPPEQLLRLLREDLDPGDSSFILL
ncbi:hypothetical protein OROHE_021898 [Orobanche hederae]